MHFSNKLYSTQKLQVYARAGTRSRTLESGRANFCIYFKRFARSRLAYLISLLLLSEPLAATSAQPPWKPEQTRVGLSGASQGNKDIQMLEPGKPSEREIAGGQIHYYLIRLASRQYLRLLVNQRGVDVMLEFVGPTGNKLPEVDVPGGHSERPREISLIIDTPGIYTLEISPVENKAAPGRYKLSIEELRIATAEDQDRAAAHRAFVQGKRLLWGGTLKSYQEALGKAEEAARLWRSLQDRQQATRASIMACVALSQIALVYSTSGKHQEAIEFYEKALQLSRATGERTIEAATLFDIGKNYYALGNSQKARDYLTEAIPLLRSMDMQYFDSFEASALLILGGILYREGEPMKALEQLNRALQIFQELRDRNMEAQTLKVIAMVCTYLNQTDLADKYYAQAEQVTLAAALPASALTDKERHRIAAHKYNQEAMRLAAPMTLDALQKSIEKFEAALKSYQAAGEQLQEANVLTVMGNIYIELNENEKALDYLKQAARLWPENNILWKLVVLLPMGRAYDALGNKKEALDCFSQVLRLSLEARDRDAEANVRYLIARANREGSNLNEARAQVEKSLDIFESLRSNVPGPDWRALYYISKQEIYEFYIDLLMQMHRLQPSKGFDSIAFQASQRSRARSWVESLNEARVDVRQKVDPDLIKRERELQLSLNANSGGGSKAC
jgi:tetratricopeptide (TPR) repeat protein